MSLQEKPSFKAPFFLGLGVCFLTVALVGCPAAKKTPAKDVAAKKATPEPVKPITYPVDKTVPAPQPMMADRSALGNQRKPWDNYKAKAPLNARLTLRDAIEANERFKKDFVGAFVRSKKIPFQLVNRFFYVGLISREDRAAQVKKFWDYAAKFPKEPELKSNIIVGLVHIGFDDEAIKLASENRNAEWFKKSASANFYAGTIPFRSGRYEEALPYLEQAHKLAPTPWHAFWLQLALAHKNDPKTVERRAKLFKFGPHMGPDDPKQFPFVDSSKKWGFGRWGLAGSMAFVDFDNDTFIDFLITGTYYSPEFYRFKPGLGFEREIAAPLTTAAHVVPSVIAADLDNDGYRDVFLGSAAWFGAGPNRVFKNNKGKGFTEITDNGDAKLLMQNTTGLTALDFDRDGLVDIATSGIKGGSTRLLKNLGNFKFKEVTDEAGISAHEQLTIHLASGDVNGDGWPDIFVNRHGANALYINQKDGTFKDEALDRGVAYGTPQGFGTWLFDYDNDGDLDIMASEFANITNKFKGGFSKFPIGHFKQKMANTGAFRPSALYKNDGKGVFTDVTEKTGIVSSSVMGTGFIDLDLDGDLDILLGPGSHPLKNMQPLFVYRNDGNDKFTNITPLSDPRYFGKLHGMAFADVDRDGDPDLYVNNGGVMLSDHWRDLFLENTTTGKTWLHIGLTGTTSNRSAIGAQVRVKRGDKVLLQQVTAGECFGATNSSLLIFGLNDAKHADSIEIRWPSGKSQKLPAVAANQALMITEGSDKVRRIY